MFSITPRLRDRLDLRTLTAVAVLTIGAFGLQLLFLARTVASPLGGAIADLDRIPQVESAPPEAIARASADPEPVLDAGARLTWSAPGAIAVAPTGECLVYR